VTAIGARLLDLPTRPRPPGKRGWCRCRRIWWRFGASTSPPPARPTPAGCCSANASVSSAAPPTTGSGTKPVTSPCRPPSPAPRSRSAPTTRGTPLCPPGCAEQAVPFDTVVRSMRECQRLWLEQLLARMGPTLPAEALAAVLLTVAEVMDSTITLVSGTTWPNASASPRGGGLAAGHRPGHPRPSPPRHRPRRTGPRPHPRPPPHGHRAVAARWSHRPTAEQRGRPVRRPAARRHPAHGHR
jgi:hypothetical protein